MPFGSPAARAEEALRTELVEASDQLLQKLSETPATSLTGLHAKAQTVLLYLPVYIDEFEAHPEDPEITFIHAFAADVIALAERGLS
ncbi:hypothetical protein GMO_11620 [Gluconobacter morbifer G707]|uniref:Uncharacterized protein n=1 Tax=Gluconobacter morbifer G707 TaxID=1088869 RepID=G6XIW2_9PROT|nr:hypothetical protein GMO_11620 [Gluconobacter morbifer G707]